MAENQPTLFDIDTLPGMACHKNTLKNPDGRTGTFAGYRAHQEAKEDPCTECLLAGQEYRKRYSKNHYAENRDYVLEYQRGYRAANRDGKLEYNKNYYTENRDEILEQKRNYYIENREDVLRKDKEYRAANPDKVALWARGWTSVRRARKLSLPKDGHTPSDITHHYGTVCYLCITEVDISLPHGSPLSPEVDHVHPLSHPDCPGDILSNVRWTHMACNRSKGNKLVSELSLPLPAPGLI